MVLTYFLAGAVLALILCLLIGYTGWAFAGFLLLFTVGCFLAIVVLHVIILFILSLLMIVNETELRHRPLYRFFLISSTELVLFFCNVRVRVEGLQHLPEGTFLLASNHRSAFDPLITMYALRSRKLSFLSKPENYKIPIAGPMMVANSFLAVDREDDRKALRTIIAAAERMKVDFCSYGVYPEGTRSHTDEMLPFRNGCFKAAQRAKVPIVVASLHNTGLISHRAPLRRTNVLIRICGALDLETVTTCKTGEIGEIVRDMLEDSLRRS